MVMRALRRVVGRIPYARRIYDAIVPFHSAPYWEQRYVSGGNSGAGSYGRLAQFKADFLNKFVRENDVRTVLEFGCGDGNQLTLAQYPVYIGLDVSRRAVQMCMQRFAGDPTKSFFLYDGDCFYDGAGVLRGDATLSLDVLYHLIEDEVFDRYMRHLFQAAGRFVIIYSADTDEVPQWLPHVRIRRFSTWIASHAPEWRLREKLANPYVYDRNNPQETSFSDFYVFERSAG